MKIAGNSLKGLKTLWEKEKLLVTSNFSFSHSVFKILLLQTHKKQGLFGKGLGKVLYQSIELTLSFPFGSAPWSLATADSMPTKTDISILLHNLVYGIELVTDRPSDAVHVIDSNAMLQSLNPFPDTFEELAEHVFNKLPK